MADRGLPLVAACLVLPTVCFCAGREASKSLQNPLRAEYAETTDRSEKDSFIPVSTSVSWAPSKSSILSLGLHLHVFNLVAGDPVFKNWNGSLKWKVSEAEEFTVGKQNRDLLRWNDHEMLEALLDLRVKSPRSLCLKSCWEKPRWWPRPFAWCTLFWPISFGCSGTDWWLWGRKAGRVVKWESVDTDGYGCLFCFADFLHQLRACCSREREKRRSH